MHCSASVFGLEWLRTCFRMLDWFDVALNESFGARWCAIIISLTVVVGCHWIDRLHFRHLRHHITWRMVIDTASHLAAFCCVGGSYPLILMFYSALYQRRYRVSTALLFSIVIFLRFRWILRLYLVGFLRPAGFFENLFNYCAY